MLKPVKQLISTALVSTIAFLPNTTAATLATVSAVSIVLSSDAALAKGKKDKKDKKDRKDRKPIKPNHGAIASDLKNLNAAHSLRNGQGYLNASANSNIGQIATYGFAEFSLGEAQEDFGVLYGELDAALKYIEDCEHTPGFECDPIIEEKSQGIIESNADQMVAYDTASSMLDAKTLKFDEAADVLGLDELLPLALDYFNILLKYGDFSTEEATEPTVVAEINIDEISLDF